MIKYKKLSYGLETGRHYGILLANRRNYLNLRTSRPKPTYDIPADLLLTANNKRHLRQDACVNA